ncbi:P-loop containing nucleoside triphosphate hydrolase protein [Daldinia sp. FL1419]|nr:P-loop containing nucleoside triphosphate hydrolase protein [Daldinia sp. FL1419]
MFSKLSSISPSTKLIAIMGMTGTGKTTFINKMTGGDLETSNSLNSCTKMIEAATVKMEDQEICLIDSPGFDDTTLSDSDILKEIAGYLQELSEDSEKLTGLLYFYNISHVRLGGTASKNIRMFRALVGNKNMKNVVLVTTRWDLVQNEREDVVKARVAELESEDGFWGGMIRLGARHEMLRDTEEDGKRILHSLLGKRAVEVQLQSQLRQGLRLIDTTAGRTLEEELSMMQAKYEKEIAEVREELAQAIREKEDGGVIAELRNAHDKAKEELEKHREELLALKEAEIQRLRAENEGLRSRGGGGGGGRCIIL